MPLWQPMWISFFFQAEDGIRDGRVTGVQTCALPICERCQGDAKIKLGKAARRRNSWPRFVPRDPLHLPLSPSPHPDDPARTRRIAAPEAPGSGGIAGPYRRDRTGRTLTRADWSLFASSGSCDTGLPRHLSNMHLDLFVEP